MICDSESYSEHFRGATKMDKAYRNRKKSESNSLLSLLITRNSRRSAMTSYDLLSTSDHDIRVSIFASIPSSAGSHFTEWRVSLVSQAAASCSLSCINSEVNEHTKQCIVK